MLNRLDTLQDSQSDSIFLFGARQTGKSTLLAQLFPEIPQYDLLDNKTYQRLHRRPELLGEELEMLADDSLVIIDEIQLLPELLNEVHRLIFKKNLRFILSGSSARKLRRRGANTLGGRALLNHLYPLVSTEIPDFNLQKALEQGMLPRHYLTDSNTAWKRMQAYISIYLKEEIKAESLVRNLQTFNRFMEIAALTNGEMVNYNNVAQDCGVDAKTVKEYFSILEETLIGYMIPAYRKVVKRKLRQSPRFYYFDVSIPNFLLNRRQLQQCTPEYGHVFEHFMILEIIAYLGYHGIDNQLTFWHTYNEYEVDAVLGDAQVAIEFKSCDEVQSRHLKGLKAFKEEHPNARLIIVSNDAKPRLLNEVEVLPANDFLKKLWQGKIY